MNHQPSFVVVGLIAGLAGHAPGQEVTKLWADNCAKCHMANGAGGEGAKSLLDDKFFGQEFDRPFFDVVKSGRDGLSDHAFGEKLSDPQVWALVNYLRELEAADHRKREGSPKAVDGVYTSQHAKFRIETVIERGLDTPWSVDFLPDGSMLVTERSGKLRVHSTGTAEGKLSETIFGVPAVRNQGQGGLMDVAVHPNYENNGWIYLAYSAPIIRAGSSQGMTRVVRGRLNGNTWAEQQTIFQAKIEHYLPTDIHYGCRIVFDPKDPGIVFFCIGERGRMEMAQDLTRPNGKVHRLRDDGRVPDDNPFVSAEDKEKGVYPSIWSYGHRNPQGLVFDLEGQLWDTEHGPRGGDELNLVKKGRNYGWPIVSYGMNYDGTAFKTPWPEGKDAESETGIVMPVDRWLPSIAACGLDVMRGGKKGEAFPDWKGDLMAGGLAGECVWRMRVKDGKVAEREEIIHGMGRVRDVVCGPGGELYVVLNGPDKVVRVVGEK